MFFVGVRTPTYATAILRFAPTKLQLISLLMKDTLETSRMNLNVQCNLHVPTFRRI
jgi:hypothetical protein